MLTAVWLDSDAKKNGIYIFHDDNRNNVSSHINNNPDVTKAENWHKLCELSELEDMKAAIAAAQSDAIAAKTKIEAFLGSITPDEVQGVIDTLAEIQKYITDDMKTFTQLSEKVINIENGITTTTANNLTIALEEEIKGYTVANAIKATDADKFGGQAPSYYATAESVTNITKTDGVIDTKIAGKLDANGWTTTEDGRLVSPSTNDWDQVSIDNYSVSVDRLSQDDSTSITSGGIFIGHYRDDGSDESYKVVGLGLSGLYENRTQETSSGPEYTHNFNFPTQSGTLLVDKDIEALQNRIIELEEKLNEVETALDRIIQIQNQLMGGN